ncbi:hypothetical protein TWF481_004902 [Arthrobotrys musiformis]|uniref:C2H2-type domain-containing protein n=1 Tax=Arthrobotrys musiformis TaxID=47236 RepID=A0AAV9WMY0_9PEZI
MHRQIKDCVKKPFHTPFSRTTYTDEEPIETFFEISAFPDDQIPTGDSDSANPVTQDKLTPDNLDLPEWLKSWYSGISSDANPQALPEPENPPPWYGYEDGEDQNASSTASSPSRSGSAPGSSPGSLSETEEITDLMQTADLFSAEGESEDTPMAPTDGLNGERVTHEGNTLNHTWRKLSTNRSPRGRKPPQRMTTIRRPRKDSKYPCTSCGRRFTENREYQLHHRRCFGKPKNFCGCGVGITRKDNLKPHYKSMPHRVYEDRLRALGKVPQTSDY